MRRRATPALLTLAVSLAVLIPAAIQPRAQHSDEAEYVWAATYYGHRVADFDFSRGDGSFDDPGWSPNVYWTSASTFGTYYIYAIALGLTGQPGPRMPHSFTDPRPPGPETQVPSRSLEIARLAAALCAALGLALITRRLGWQGLVATTLFLAAPNVRGDLTRAWAEGPLLLGFGLCASAFGTRWFGVACGVATTFKLTALGLWPLILWRRTNGGLSRVKAALLAAVTWTLLVPPSWWALGPLYFVQAIRFRASQFEGQSGSNLADVHDGVFLPSRYLLQIELLAALALAFALSFAMRRIRVAREPVQVTG
jgi:hypothetical protein